MSEEFGERVERAGSVPTLVLAVIALVSALGALIWCFGLNNHVAETEKQLALANKQNAEQTEQIQALSARLRATTETMGASVGMTQKQIDIKTASILASQRAESTRLEAEQAAAAQKITAVASDVSSVKTDVGGAKTDIAATRSDLEATKTQLQRAIGDEGVMSGLIATNHDELEVLKHKGDRTYLEFNLQKGAKPTLLATIKLQAKKVDDKHSRFTLGISSDDRNIEKKDKTLDEPIQFYSGKDPALYEIVVNSMDKHQISGYLSLPKGAPQAMNSAAK